MTRRPAVLVVPLATGAVVALGLGLYASAHQPTGRNFVITGFDSVGAWKSAFTSVVTFLFVVQVSLGIRLDGRRGPRVPAPPWARDAHRLIGTIAFGLSIPVVFHCIWTLGYRSDDLRVVAHSVLGCVAYGLYVTKLLTVRTGDERPVWALPVVGSLLGSIMLAIWWTSAFVFYTESAA